MVLYEGEGNHPIAIDLFWRTITNTEQGDFHGELSQPGKEVVWTDPASFVGQEYDGIAGAGDEYDRLTAQFDDSDIQLEVHEDGNEHVRYKLTYEQDGEGQASSTVAQFEGVLTKDDYDTVTANHFYLPGIAGFTETNYTR